VVIPRRCPQPSLDSWRECSQEGPATAGLQWPYAVANALIVLAHVLSPSLDLFGFLLIHPGDFISGVTKRMQDFI
jgi:hypothetical protein